MKLFIALSIICCGFKLEADLFHHREFKEEWVEETVAPFDELILTWNGKRPMQGKYFIYVSVKLQEWSPEFLYATWGKNSQSTFLSTSSDVPVRSYQDVIEIMKGEMATGFRIRIKDEKGVAIASMLDLHVYTNGIHAKEKESTSFSSILLDVDGISQMRLDHSRSSDLCSPTSTFAAVRFLSQRKDLDPLQFVKLSWDEGFDIFGNWVLNLAQASIELGSSWDAWVQRLEGFEDIYERLIQKIPVVVSVRGPLPGGALPYSKGHLLVVIGYEAENQKVICMDPAFPTDPETRVSYRLSDFIQAWTRRGNIAYIFSHR